MMTSLLSVLAIAVPALFAAPAPPETTAATTPASTPTGFLNKSLTSSGQEFKYVVYVPREYASKPGEKWPLILFMHGSGESGTDGLKQVIQGIGSAVQWNVKEWPFIIIFPQKPLEPKQWEDYDAPVMAMLEATRAAYSTDPDRLYLTGLSQGGHGTWMFAANHPDVWAAIAPICGYMRADFRAQSSSSEAAAALAAKLKHLPVWAFHGDADDVVNPAETKAMVDALKQAGADVKGTYYPGVGHFSWDKVYREENLAAWFLSHTKGK